MAKKNGDEEKLNWTTVPIDDLVDEAIKEQWRKIQAEMATVTSMRGALEEHLIKYMQLKNMIPIGKTPTFKYQWGGVQVALADQKPDNKLDFFA